jgi:ribonuclease P protein component
MNVEKQYSFVKLERLCSKMHVARLYQSGFVINKYPLRIHVLRVDCEDDIQFPVQIIINASKRGLRKAVHRNLMKRRLRELYRYNKSPLYSALNEKNEKLHLSLVYYGSSIIDFWTLEKAFLKVWKRLLLEWPNIINQQKEK